MPDYINEMENAISDMMHGTPQWRKIIQTFSSHLLLVSQKSGEFIDLCNSEQDSGQGLIAKVNELDKQMTKNRDIHTTVQSVGTLGTVVGGALYVVAGLNLWNPMGYMAAWAGTAATAAMVGGSLSTVTSSYLDAEEVKSAYENLKEMSDSTNEILNDINKAWKDLSIEITAIMNLLHIDEESRDHNHVRSLVNAMSFFTYLQVQKEYHRTHDAWPHFKPEEFSESHHLLKEWLIKRNLDSFEDYVEGAAPAVSIIGLITLSGKRALAQDAVVTVEHIAIEMQSLLAPAPAAVGVGEAAVGNGMAPLAGRFLSNVSRGVPIVNAIINVSHYIHYMSEDCPTQEGVKKFANVLDTAVDLCKQRREFVLSVASEKNLHDHSSGEVPS